MISDTFVIDLNNEVRPDTNIFDKQVRKKFLRVLIGSLNILDQHERN